MPVHGEENSSVLKMQSELIKKARNLGRPLSSFRQRDMTLNDAQPSVLEHANKSFDGFITTHQAIRTISAPRTVYAQFQAAPPKDDGQLDASNDDVAKVIHEESENAATRVDHTVTRHREDPLDATKLNKVQFEDSRNQVTTYTPSPDASPSAARPRPHQQATSQSSNVCSADVTLSDGSNGQVQVEEDDLHSGSISRCASNLAARAGTFDELISSSLGLHTDHQQHTLFGDGADAGMCANSLSTGPAISADKIVAHPLALVDSILDSSLTSYASLGTQSRSRCPPTRRVANMMSCAGTFEEVLDSAEVAVENELFDGTISRRATNMHTAAGAFEELVDEDGDELEPEEDSCSSLTSIDDIAGVDISLSGMVSNMPNAATTVSELQPLISLHDHIQGSHQPQPIRGRWERVISIPAVPAAESSVGATGAFSGALPSDGFQGLEDLEGSNPVADEVGESEFLKPRAELQLQGPDLGLVLQHSDHRNLPQGTVGEPQPFQSMYAQCHSEDRVAVVLDQIKALKVDEQKLILSKLSAELLADENPPKASLSKQLSIHTPHRTLKQFQADEGSDDGFLGGQTASSTYLQKASSVAGMTVRTPRAKYNVVFSGQENGELPSAMAALDAIHDSAGKAILTPMEWSLKISRKPAVHAAPVSASTAGGGKVLKHEFQQPEGRTARLQAYRPDSNA